MWVEDKAENAELGVEMGLNTFLIDHVYNQGEFHEVTRVKNWKEIYEYVG
jgi:uncharacterized HAD superfamily protein